MTFSRLRRAGGMAALGIALVMGSCSPSAREDVFIPQSRHETSPYANMTWDEARAYVKTPSQAKDYILFLTDTSLAPVYYSGSEQKEYCVYSGRYAHDLRRFGDPSQFPKNIDCSEAAFAAAGMLDDDGFPPNVLYIEERPDKNRMGRAHLVYTWQYANDMVWRDHWNSMGYNATDNQPGFSSPMQLGDIVGGLLGFRKPMRVIPVSLEGIDYRNSTRDLANDLSNAIFEQIKQTK